MSQKNTPHIVRIGGFFLLLSATIIGWASFSNKHDTQFWSIGSYTIPSLSAREDEDEDDEDDEDEGKRERRERSERDNDDTEYIKDREETMVPIQTTPIQAQTKNVIDTSNNTPTTPVATPELTFDNQADIALQAFGFSDEEKQQIKDQFKTLAHDVAVKYPSPSSQITVFQNLIKEANEKIQELEAFSEVETSAIISSKIPSIQALIALANIQIKLIQTPISLPKQNITPRQVRKISTTRVIQNTQPKTITPSQTNTTTTISTPSVSTKTITPIVKTPPKVSTKTQAS